MSEREHEIITMELDRDDLPTKGEWMRACSDRRVLESARMAHVGDPKAEGMNLTAALRGERFVAVPQDAYAVAFIWRYPQTNNGAPIEPVEAELAPAEDAEFEILDGDDGQCPCCPNNTDYGYGEESEAVN